MSTRPVLAALALAVAATGCGGHRGGQTTVTVDCQRQLRVGAAVYTSPGYTDRPATPLGTAEEARCHDTGQDARGSVFTDASPTVATFAFPGYPAAEVLGVRSRDGEYAVYVAVSAGIAESERIYAELTDDPPAAGQR